MGMEENIEINNGNWACVNTAEKKMQGTTLFSTQGSTFPGSPIPLIKGYALKHIRDPRIWRTGSLCKIRWALWKAKDWTVNPELKGFRVHCVSHRIPELP